MPSTKPFGLAVKALVTDDEGRVLLIRRSAASKHDKHQWDLPGGKVDPGEPFDVALLREVEEETGLSVSIEGVAGAAEYEVTEVRVAMLFLEARRTAGTVRLSDEHDQSAWVARQALGKMDLSRQLREFVLAYCAER